MSNSIIIIVIAMYDTVILLIELKHSINPDLSMDDCNNYYSKTRIILLFWFDCYDINKITQIVRGCKRPSKGVSVL